MAAVAAAVRVMISLSSCSFGNDALELQEGPVVKWLVHRAGNVVVLCRYVRAQRFQCYFLEIALSIPTYLRLYNIFFLLRIMLCVGEGCGCASCRRILEGDMAAHLHSQPENGSEITQENPDRFWFASRNVDADIECFEVPRLKPRWVMT